MDTKIRNLERRAACGDTDAMQELEVYKVRLKQLIPGYAHLMHQRVLLLGARWHYEGILIKCDGQFLTLDDCRHVFNYTREDGITIHDQFDDLIRCNHNHVSSVCLSPFDDREKVSAKPGLAFDMGNIAGFEAFMNKRILLLGARWHYEGKLIGSNGDYFLLEDCNHVFNYTVDGVSVFDPLPGIVSINNTHIASIILAQFNEKSVSDE